MNKNQVTTKRAYLAPEISVFAIEAGGHLLDTSFPSQHKPGQPGTGPMPSSAKQNFFDDFDEDEDEIDDIPQSQPL
nr:hypothetical protein [Hoylesella enoeca]